MLWLLVVLILILWALGFFGSVGGSLIHLLLVVALVAILYEIFVNRRRL